MKAVNIDPFAAVPAGQFETDGKTHNVLHLTGREYRTLNGEYTVAEAFDIASRIVPSLGAAVDELTPPQIGAIIGIASGRVTDVETQFPNSDGPSPSSATATTAPA